MRDGDIINKQRKNNNRETIHINEINIYSERKTELNASTQLKTTIITRERLHCHTKSHHTGNRFAGSETEGSNRTLLLLYTPPQSADQGHLLHLFLQRRNHDSYCGSQGFLNICTKPEQEHWICSCYFTLY